MQPPKQPVEDQATDLNWCSLNVVLDDDTTELFQMPAPDGNAEQQPVFRVTNSTANLVTKDFALYQPSLQRMADNWREAKEHAMQEEKADSPNRGDTTI
jgi:hypothetical protein